MDAASHTDLLTWNESKNVLNFAREQAIEQFINIYNQWKHRDGDPFKWGDEVKFLNNKRLVINNSH